MITFWHPLSYLSMKTQQSLYLWYVFCQRLQYIYKRGWLQSCSDHAFVDGYLKQTKNWLFTWNNFLMNRQRFKQIIPSLWLSSAHHIRLKTCSSNDQSSYWLLLDNRVIVLVHFFNLILFAAFRFKYNLNALSHDTAIALINMVLESGVNLTEVTYIRSTCLIEPPV